MSERSQGQTPNPHRAFAQVVGFCSQALHRLVDAEESLAPEHHAKRHLRDAREAIYQALEEAWRTHAQEDDSQNQDRFTREDSEETIGDATTETAPTPATTAWAEDDEPPQYVPLQTRPGTHRSCVERGCSQHPEVYGRCQNHPPVWGRTYCTHCWKPRERGHEHQEAPYVTPSRTEWRREWRNIDLNEEA